MKRITLFSFLMLFAVGAFAQGTAISLNITVVDANNNPVPNHPITLVDSSFMGSWYSLTTNTWGVVNSILTIPSPPLGSVKQLYLITSDNCNNLYSTDTVLTAGTSQFSWAYTFVVCAQGTAGNCNFNVMAQTNAISSVFGFSSTYVGGPNSVFTWSFGDGTSAVGQTVAHTYAQPGTYVYCLTVDSCQVCDTLVVGNTAPCDATFTASTNGPTAELFPVSLGAPGTFVFNWGDGTADTVASSAMPLVPYNHTYASSGMYSICVEHFDSTNCYDQSCDSVVIYQNPFQCNASFIIDTINSQPGTVYAWNMSAVTGGSAATIVNFIWDFGDGTTSNQPYPTHNYQNPGSYAICLTMTAVDSSLITCISTYCDSLTVDQNGNIIYKGALVGWNFVVLNPASIGIDESVLEQTKIYPNPAKDVLTIELPEAATTAEARVFSVSGALVNVVQLQAGTNTLDVATLPTGLYVLHLKSDVATTQIKFVKQ